MMRSLLLLATAFSCAPAAPAQEPARPAPERDADFRVDFDGPAEPVPPGITVGINDLLNASEGCWRAYAKALRPEGGLARIWIKYHRNELGRSHFTACERARAAGMGVFLTVTGSPHQEQMPGRTFEHALEAPPDAKQWAGMVAEDVNELLDQGLPVRFVEIWNEPDLAGHWDGGQQEFARFFAAAGAHLRDQLPGGVRLGGPGMATGWGGGRRYFRDLLDACLEAGFRPDFLSWHDYQGYPTDQELSRIPEGNLAVAREAGLRDTILVLSEWNIALPMRRAKKELDNHENAAYFVAMSCGLAQTPVQHSLFFFLQDGFWETKKDYGGESVGVFTIHGAPKAVLSGMRMFRKASELPRVPLQRRRAPGNLAAMATRSGDRAFVVAANSFGDAQRSMRKYAEHAGIDLSMYKDKEAKIRRYLGGDIPFRALGAPEHHQEIWDEVRRRMEADRRERGMEDRTVTFELRGAPDRIDKVWVVDETHGNPLASEDFQEQFAPYRDGKTTAIDLALQRLEDEGVPANEVAAVQAAFRRREPGSIRGVTSETEARARQAYEEAVHHLEVEVPMMLAEHPASFPAEVKSDRWAKLDGSTLSVRVPPHSAVLVQCRWGGSDRKDEPSR